MVHNNIKLMNMNKYIKFHKFQDMQNDVCYTHPRFEKLRPRNLPYKTEYRI